MSTLAAVLAQGTARLKEAHIDQPQLDARLLLQAACNLTRSELLLREQEPVAVDQLLIFESLINRRCAREPVARILGEREFWGLPFKLSAATLEPRPDSETLIEAVLAARPDRSAALRILDLGAGTGCLLGALLHEYQHAQGCAVDLSPQAAQTAQANLTALGLADRAQVLAGSWFEPAPGVFDIIISNPPYLRDVELQEVEPEVARFDPTLALTAGPDGLEAYRAIVAAAPAYLADGGLLVLELGRGQGPAVSQLAQAAGLLVKEIREDLGGIGRALVLVKS